MRVMITASGPSLDDKLDERFGRARYFLIVETESGEAVAVDNSEGMNAAQGAGPRAAQTAVDHKASCLITGHVGPSAFAGLTAAGVPVFLAGEHAQKSCREVLDLFKEGKLKTTSAATTAGHW